MKICIIGAGWYGLHIAYLLQNKHKITIFEEMDDIFNNSSYHNQRRLHLGFHYPRCYKTRVLCLKGFNRFIKNYEEVIDDISNNYYCISNDSFIDFETYKQIYNSNEYLDKYTIIDNNGILENIDGKFLDVKEKIINSDKAKKYFKNKINQCDFIFNYKVTKIENINNKVNINNEYTFDMVFDCTYGKLNKEINFLYEKTITLLYRKIQEPKFNAITIMDGHFSSLYPLDGNCILYSLTNVKYTPLITSYCFNTVENYKITENIVQDIKNNMEKEIEKYIPNFKNIFLYDSYFIAYKTKSINNNNDNRDCNIIKNKNIFHICCGKITGIFKVEDYFRELKLI